MITLLPDIASGHPWKHYGSKRANTEARAFEKQCADSYARSQLSHWNCAEKSNSACLRAVRSTRLTHWT